MRTVMGGLFGPKGEEITRKWRKMYNEELHNLHLPQIVFEL
jgi:hypothetical protein